MRFKFKIKKQEIIGIVAALFTILISFIFLRGRNEFYFLLSLSFVIAGLPFFIDIVIESSKEREKEEMFLEFTRDLVENVRSGTPISKAIVNVREKDYGVLNPYINKLANQIILGIPFKTALETFARDLRNKVITRAINIINESERSGGQIEDILDSVAKSVTQVEKLKKEMRSTMYSLIVQGYIIFLLFIAIMLILEFKILPIAEFLQKDVGKIEQPHEGFNFRMFSGGEKIKSEEVTTLFLWLLIIQAFFTGLVVGKISEGSFKTGLKHSFILTVLALIIFTGSKLIFK